MSMYILPENKVLEIVKQFKTNIDFVFVRVIDYEPDCKVYILKDEDNNEYALIARDYTLEDIDAEKRILAMELGIEVLDRFLVKKNGDYWYKDRTLDTFRYVFNLNRIKFKG